MRHRRRQPLDIGRQRRVILQMTYCMLTHDVYHGRSRLLGVVHVGDGVAEAWAAGYLSKIPHPFNEGGISTGYKEAVGFTVLILIILLRPQGLLGTRGGDRA